VARYKSTARDLGAFICFEDEAGQGLRPPRGRTWAPRGARPVVRVRGAGGGRVSIAGVACYRPGDRPHLFFKLRICRRRKGEPKGFTWQDYRDLIIAAHRQLAAPLVWVWDNLNVHLAPELASFAAENKAWLRVYRLPAYAPDMNPAEGIWSLLKRSMVNFAAADVAGLVRIIKRKLKKIQYRPHLIDGCLAATGLNIEPLVTPCTTNSTWLASFRSAAAFRAAAFSALTCSRCVRSCAWRKTRNSFSWRRCRRARSRWISAHMLFLATFTSDDAPDNTSTKMQ